MSPTKYEIINKAGVFQAKDHSKQELVSALMITKGDINLISKSIKIFSDQTWRNKELCIVSRKTDDDYTIKGTLEKASINFQLKFISEDLSLGNMRNISMSIANGSYACTWDDDDLYASSRISTMMEAIRQSNTVASFLKQVILYYPAQNKMAISRARVWENTMIVKRSCAPAYQDINRGEDSSFVKNLMRHHEIALVDDPGQYAYVRTGMNTVGEEHFSNLFHRAEKQFNRELTKELLSNFPCFKCISA